MMLMRGLIVSVGARNELTNGDPERPAIYGRGYFDHRELARRHSIWLNFIRTRMIPREDKQYWRLQASITMRYWLPETRRS